jgi:hypothetical protein
VGAIAVLFRQTNIIWIFFIAGISVFNDFKSLKSKKDLVSFLEYIKRNFVNICLKYFLFLAVALAFVIFLILNKGIVVGTIYF